MVGLANGPKASDRCFYMEGLLEKRQIRKKKTFKVVRGGYPVGRLNCQKQGLREKERRECISRTPEIQGPSRPVGSGVMYSSGGNAFVDSIGLSTALPRSITLSFFERDGFTRMTA